MKLHLHLFAIILAGFMSFAHAEPEQAASNKPNLGIFADPIAQFAAPGEEAVGDLLLQAMSLLGVAYRFGGSSPETGLDCSGFIQYVFRKSLRVNLPRTSAEMARAGRVIERDELAPGDLVFYNTRGFQYSHVGLYLGGNKFIHSPRTGKSVEVVSMASSYWAQRFNGARRVSRGGSEWKEPVAEKKAAEKNPAGKPAADKPAAEKGKRSTRTERRKAARAQEAERKSASRKKSGQSTRKKKKPD
ncbi:C40 family peptidase [Vogesella fluminis]|nr:C40 family peptidase [Vogesella fluminis]